MMNLADPDLELIDPTPNVHAMFLNFDQTFFWSKLSSRCIVRWSKRMYSCAGTATYEGRGGLCKIALSEPLLKLRPRKDLVETLLHEMIHAYLFVTNKDQDRDGHGPNFQAHMHRINRAAGLNISIYHDFHDEVKLYQTHWWRCNGPCQFRKPYFGIVRRTNNRAPGPSEHWWKYHQKNCGGTFIKIQEPEKPEKKSKKNSITKPNADITKYINNNNNTKEASNKNIIKRNDPNISVLKDSNSIFIKSKINTMINSNRDKVIISVKKPIANPEVPKLINNNTTGSPIGKGERNNDKHATDSVIATVRSVWANKQIGKIKTNEASKHAFHSSTPIKHKANDHTESPPCKMKKINDYFKHTATTVLKNLYGQDFDLTQSKNNEKIILVPKINNTVNCPVCFSKIDAGEVNKHLDECLNKGLIAKIDKKVFSVKNECKVDNESDEIRSEITVCTEVFETSLEKELDENGRRNKDYTANNNVEEHVNKKSKVDLIENDKIKSEITVCTEVFETSLEKELEEYDRRNKAYKGNNIVEEHVNQNVRSRVSMERHNKNDSFKRPRTSLNIDDYRTSEEVRINEVKKLTNIRKSDSFIAPMLNTLQDTIRIMNPSTEPGAGCSKIDSTSDIACPCCGEKLTKSADEHLDECLSFFDNNTTIPNEGASTSYETIVIDDDDDDKFDESQTFNDTGTKHPCPCCLKMVEEVNMNSHLDECLS